MKETVIHKGVDPRVIGESESFPKVFLEQEQKRGWTRRMREAEPPTWL